jgi:hypothetical protein
MQMNEEVRVDMANNTADIGSVGQVTVVSKSGSNEFHGSLFTYYTTPWFRARNPFAAQRPGGIVHQPGFAIGGPITIPGVYDGMNRTFFFGSFETSRGSDILQLLNPSVPIPGVARGRLLRPLDGGPRSVRRRTAARQPSTGLADQPGFAALPGPLLPAAQLRRSERLQLRRTTANR